MTTTTLLPSWRPGTTRDALVSFLDQCRTVPVADRVAYFDNDGTLWCERPTYAQFDFYLDALRRRVADDTALGEREEFAALLSGDQGRVAALGLPRIALALAGLFEGQTPEEFAAEVRSFAATARHTTLGRPLRSMVYQPMLELMEALRDLDFTIGIVTGGGTEFVRAISEDFYGVPAELVVGTLVDYTFTRDPEGRPQLVRTAQLLGGVNEGEIKVSNIQTQLGRRPIFAAGNSAGDREMLEWAASGRHPGFALLIDHDDAEREFAYVGEAVSLDGQEPITAVAGRQGWTTVSMSREWDPVFSPAE
ncbi:haloacid dehalogenase-like hydrolase [Ornithinimicrobium sp. F0845]|uniref:HAD family hydrolase n=1 Tax=Ornithinimicrobium sp. F0845 TaxID=2926412 RepID=UPI001FF57909|nr:HAD family hydrolase [Ornithinimicrobium sp. F0845]MCK0113583.1 haloacid dehalogenase-like hydrolase [Ornithinimicrobium sp. F0845]